MYDERYYEQVVEELRRFGPRSGLWAKSFAEANGDDAKAKALYLRYRVDQIKHEAAIQAELAAQAEAERQKTKWQHEEKERNLLAKAEGVTPIHIILLGLPILMLILVFFRLFFDGL